MFTIYLILEKKMCCETLLINIHIKEDFIIVI